MGIAAEVVDGERFVRAWQRFRERFPEDQLNDEHRDMLQQYVATARFYHDKILRIHGLEQGSKLVEALSGISMEAEALVEAKCLTVQPVPYRVPRPSEFLKRRRQAADAASTVAERAEPTAFPSSPKMSEQQSPEKASPEMMNLSYDDLKAIMETKKTKDENLSTQELRRRLGLIDRDRDRDAVAMSSETAAREEQESIQADMVNLAKTLKARTQTINESLVDDVKILDAVGESAESSATRLEREHAMLKQQLATSIGLWTSLWLVMAAVMVFMATYIYMKLFSRRL